MTGGVEGAWRRGSQEYIKDRKIVADSGLQSVAALRPVCTSVRGPNYLVTSRAGGARSEMVPMV